MINQPGAILLREAAVLDTLPSAEATPPMDSDGQMISNTGLVLLFSVAADWIVTSVDPSIDPSMTGSCTVVHNFDAFCTSRNEYFFSSTATKNPPVFCLCGKMRMLKCNIPHTLTYKLENLRQKDARKVTEVDLFVGHKMKKFFSAMHQCISHPCKSTQQPFL